MDFHPTVLDVSGQPISHVDVQWPQPACHRLVLLLLRRDWQRPHAQPARRYLRGHLQRDRAEGRHRVENRYLLIAEAKITEC